MTTSTVLAARPVRTPLPAALTARSLPIRPPARLYTPGTTRSFSGLTSLLEPVLLVISASLVSLVIASVAAGAFIG